MKLYMANKISFSIFFILSIPLLLFIIINNQEYSKFSFNLIPMLSIHLLILLFLNRKNNYFERIRKPVFVFATIVIIGHSEIGSNISYFLCFIFTALIMFVFSDFYHMSVFEKRFYFLRNDYSFFYKSLINSLKLLFYIVFSLIFIFVFIVLKGSSFDMKLHLKIVEIISEINPSLVVFLEHQKYYVYRFNNYYSYSITNFIQIIETIVFITIILYFVNPKNSDIPKKERNKKNKKNILRKHDFFIKFLLHFIEKNLIKFLVLLFLLCDFIQILLLKDVVIVKFKDEIYSYMESNKIINEVIFKEIALFFLKLFLFSNLYYKRNRSFFYHNNLKFLLYFTLFSLFCVFSFFVLNILENQHNVLLNVVIKKITFIFIASLIILFFRILYIGNLKFIKIMIIIQLLFFIFLLYLNNQNIFKKYIDFIFFVDVILMADIIMIYKNKIENKFSLRNK